MKANGRDANLFYYRHPKPGRTLASRRNGNDYFIDSS